MVREADTLLDELPKGQRPEGIFSDGSIVQDLTKRLVERALEGEMFNHLGYEKSAVERRNGGNSRNGKTRKRLVTGVSSPRSSRRVAAGFPASTTR